MADDKKPAPDAQKKWGKRLLWGGAILLAIVIFGGSGKKWAFSPKEIESSRKYAAHYNWSKESPEFFVKEVVIPSGSEGWVSIALPLHYRIKTSRTFDVEYDLGTIGTVKEGPNLPTVKIDDFPALFDVKATGEGGVLKIWLHRNPQVVQK